MAYTEIVITRFGDHLVSMLLKDGHPVEFQCLSEKNKVDIGNIYIGVVKNVVKNINGAFVEFDQDEIGFLSMRHRQYKAGDEVLVQIKKEATEEKRPMLSDQIELTGEYLVLTSDKLSVGISNKIHQKEKKTGIKRNGRDSCDTGIWLYSPYRSCKSRQRRCSYGSRSVVCEIS